MKNKNKLLADFLELETILFHGNLYIANEEDFDLMDSVKFDPRLDWNDLMRVIELIHVICTNNDDLEKFFLIKDKIPHLRNTYDECGKFVNWYNNEKI